MRVWLLAMIVLYGFVIGVLVLQVGSDLLSR
jgi:hypothetical protein